MASKDLFIVKGEASESDDEDYMSPVHRGKMKPNELIASIAGEDASSEDDLNITISAFASKIEEEHNNTKYNSLFHKKLQESNWKFKEGFKMFIKSIYRTSGDQINEINQMLLTTQIQTQDTLKLLRDSQAAARNIDFTLSAILSQGYVPHTNVIVIK